MGDKYAETKVFICTGCGKEITATKFASQKTIKCDECKENNAPINPEIVAQAMQKNPPKMRKQSDGSTTKIRPCIKCGKETEVSKFMSDQKVLCNGCKGEDTPQTQANKITVDQSKLSKIKMPPIEEYEINGGIIANKRLREVKCPACGHEYMKPLMIIDKSMFGMVIEYQCSSCLLTMTISEQTRQKLKIHSPSKRFDYTGNEIKTLGMSYRDSSRMANALTILIEKCKECDIDIDSIMKEANGEFPEFIYENDKPVPIGFEIPKEDKWIGLVSELEKLFRNATRVGDVKDVPEGNRNIMISDTLANTLADKLSELLKGE